MNFFERQDVARRKTRWLIVFFVGAAALTALCVGSALTGIAFLESGAESFDWGLMGFLSGGVCLTIAAGSIYKMSLISSGGESIALALGGRLLTHSNALSDDEKMLLNVVDEMAIASGVTVPKVFLLDGESGINAFAAGFRTHDAVIGVTRGALTNLSRDELQGVIAHEFSHILNGDMLLNMRLMGMLYGLMLLTIIGRIFVRVRGKKSGGLIGVGFVLFILGWIGYFWGRLIQAAVSRQREFLADSSAVQFTRNPDGIYNALKKIGLTAMGSLIKHPHSEETRHFFFSDAFPATWMNWWATHPPLEVRLKAIHPIRREKLPDFSQPPIDPPSDYVVQRFASPRPLSPSFATAIHDPIRVQNILTALILMKAGLSTETNPEIESAAKQIRAAKTDLFSILSLSLSTLDSYSDPQLEALEMHLKEPVTADHKLSIFDFCVLKLISLKRQKKRGLQRIAKYHSFRGLKKPMRIMLSTFCHYSKNDTINTFTSSGRILGFEAHELLPPRLCGLKEFSKATDELLGASAPLRSKCLETLARAVVYDGQILPEEDDLLRTLAMILECPLPDFVTKVCLGRPAQTA